jgi:type IV pilus assembly protein PilW
MVRVRAPRNLRETGFSLVEMMVALVISSLLMIAIFHINSTFNMALHRQDEIGRMQQTMKVVRTILERRIRAAGAGAVFRTQSSCGGNHMVGPIIIHNSNSLTGSDLTTGDADPDPDWFEILSADLSRSGRITAKAPVMGNDHSVDDTSKFKPGDLIGLKYKDGMCLLMVTKVQSNGKIQFGTQGTGAAAMANCYNDPQLNKLCEDLVVKNHFMFPGDEVVNFGSGSFAMRVDTTNPDLPMLMMASGTVGGSPASYQWQPVAGNVEDMQIAAHVDTSVTPDDLGDMWVNSRDLTIDELSRVRAVRITLVFRSTTTVTGWNLGRRPGFEDRAAATVDDGYVRRVLTLVIKLRNRSAPET